MILKSKDSLDSELARLQQKLAGTLASSERLKVGKQLAQIRSGIRGEKEAAYHIDFFLKDSLNWAVIHDLRIEWKGRVAQIDHLILSRCLEVYVVESKNYGTKVRYANGGWERLVCNVWEGIPCPVEQNERHILVLKRLIRECGLAPTRLGISLQPAFFNVILVAPSCSILGKFPGNARVYRMDKLTEQISKVEGSPLSVLKVVSSETVHQLGRRLVARHAPRKENKSLATMPIRSNAIGATAKKACDKCQNCEGAISSPEKSFCQSHKGRFGGQLLCRNCQKFAPAVLA